MADLFFAAPDSDLDLEIEVHTLDGVQNNDQEIFVGKLLEHNDSIGGCDAWSMNHVVFGTRTIRSSTTDRAPHIHTARVYLAQSRRFAHRARGFSFVLLRWAANARRRAAAINTGPVQGDLFEGKA